MHLSAESLSTLHTLLPNKPASAEDLRFVAVINLKSGLMTFDHGFLWLKHTQLQAIGPKTIQHVINTVVADLGRSVRKARRSEKRSSKQTS